MHCLPDASEDSLKLFQVPLSRQKEFIQLFAFQFLVVLDSFRPTLRAFYVSRLFHTKFPINFVFDGKQLGKHVAKM